MHEARLAASSSCGVGPASSPALVLRLVHRELVPADLDPVGVLLGLAGDGLLHQLSGLKSRPGRNLGIEVGRLRRHALARRRHVLDLRHRRRSHEEGGIVCGALHQVQGLVEVTRVPEPSHVVDVLVAHLERALEDQRLEHGGIEPAVGLGMVGQGAIGDRRVLEREPERLLEVRVDVAEDDAIARGRGKLRRARQRLDLEVVSDRGGQRLVLLGGEALEQAMRGKHREPRVLERDQAHEHVAVRALAADLLGVHPCGLVAVVTVGDQQLGPAQRLGQAGDHRLVLDVPEPVHGPVVVGRLRPGRLLRRLFERVLRLASGIVVEREDRGEVRLGGAGKPEPVFLGAGVGALVGPDPSRAVVLHASPGEEPGAGPPAAVRSGVVLGQRPYGRLGVLHQHALARATARTAAPPRRMAPRPWAGRSGPRCTGDRASSSARWSASITSYGRRDHVIQATDPGEVVVQGAQRLDRRHPAAEATRPKRPGPMWPSSTLAPTPGRGAAW